MSSDNPICPDTVQHVAKLARIAIDPEQCQHLSNEMHKVVELFEQLAAVDDSQLTIDESNTITEATMRDDQVTEADFSAELAQFSDYFDPTTGYIQVPTVIESEDS